MEKPTTEFYRSNVRYYQRECKACTRERRSAWWRSPQGKESSRTSKLKARFGIDSAQYSELLQAQGGKCAICGANASHSGHRLAVDHNHTTSEIRGLLCKSCNVGIGNLQDSAMLCTKAAEYLSRFGKQSI